MSDLHVIKFTTEEREVIFKVVYNRIVFLEDLIGRMKEEGYTPFDVSKDLGVLIDIKNKLADWYD